MKKALSILLLVLVTFGLFVACDVDAVGTVFKTEQKEVYATLVGYSETKGKKSGSNEFGTVIKNAVIQAGISESDISEYKYRFTIEFQANATTQPTEFIVSTPDSPQKAWVEVAKAKKAAAPVYNIYIKTAGSKFMANENSQEMFMAKNNNAKLFQHVTEINFNGVFDTSNATSMQSMFENCRALRELDVTGFDTSKVTSMASMFENCESVESLDLTSFNTANVELMDEMFDQCWALKSVDLSGFNTSKVTDMGNMFCACKALETIDVSNFDTSNVTDMSNMFNRCYKLEIIDLFNFDMSKVTDVYDMFAFEEAAALTEVKFGSGATQIGSLDSASSIITGNCVDSEHFCFTGPKAVLDALRLKLGGGWKVKTEGSVDVLKMYDN